MLAGPDPLHGTLASGNPVDSAVMQDEEPTVQPVSLAEEPEVGLPEASPLQQTVVSGSLSAGIDIDSGAPAAAGVPSIPCANGVHG